MRSRRSGIITSFTALTLTLVLGACSGGSAPTTANSGISDGGKTYTIHLRSGVMWDTTPPRQVTAADFVRGFKFLCNPASPVAARDRRRPRR